MDSELTQGTSGELLQVQEVSPYLEGGDSACWTGHYLYLGGTAFTQDYEAFYSNGKGGFVRHPDESASNNGFGAHYSHPWDGVISRDQLTGVLLGLVAQNNKLGLLKVALHSLAWLGLFTYNTRINGQAPGNTAWKWPDAFPPSTWQMLIRGLVRSSRLLQIAALPILIIGDLNLLLDTALVNRSEKDDVINYLGRLFVANDIAPTFISRMALRAARKDKLKAALHHYWCNWRRNCGMYKLFVDKLDSYK